MPWGKGITSFSRLLLAVVVVVLAREDRLAAARFALTDEYVIDNWQTEDGLPENSATAMAQTPDGYLWISTFNGLVRFDGGNFRAFDASNTPELPARRLANLHLARNGELWISFEQGLSIYRDGRFTRLPASAGYRGDFARTFSESPDGTLWVTTFNGQLYQVRGREFRELPYPVPGGGGGTVGATDRPGRFYVLKPGGDDPYFGIWTGAGWARLDPGVPLESEASMLGSSAPGEVWLLAGSVLQQWSDGRKVQERRINGRYQGAWSLHPDSDGRIWVPSYESGLYRVELDGAVTHFSNTNGLAYNSVRFVFEDRQRNRWIGTSGGGLMRFFERRVSMYGPGQGLAEPVVKSVAALPDGRLAVGTWKKGVFVIDPATGQIRNLDVGRAGYIQGVLSDARGRLWVATYGDGTWMVDAEGARQIWRDDEAGINMISLFRDRQDRIWATGDNGVTRIDGDERTTFANPAEVGSAGFIAMSESTDGQLLAGTMKGLFEFKKDRFEPFRLAGGPVPTEVMALLADDENRLWVGSSLHGLFLIRGGRSVQLGELEGVATRSVTGLARDDQGRLWLATNRGLMAARIAELEAVADGRIGRAQVITLGPEDGLASQECATSHQPIIAATPDGAMWFATGKGVARIHPAGIRPHSVPPSVLLDELRYQAAPRPQAAGDATGRAVGRLESLPLGVASSPVELAPGSRFLEITYNSAEFTHPQRIRFETRIEGAGDDRWRFVNDRRTAYFPDLRPGRYRFQVRAYNQDGVPSERPATLAFAIAPYYWQTWWFQGGTLATLLALAGGAIRHELVRRGRVRRVLAEAQEAARERYVQVIENTSDLVGFASPERKIIYANRAARRAMGFSENEAIDHLTPRDIYPEWAYRRISEEGLPTAMREGIWQGNSALRTRDGRELPVWQVLVVHRKPDGSLDFVSSIGKDMSEIVRAGQALRMSEDKFAKVFHSSPDAIVISSVPTGELLDVNQSFEEMCGRSRSEVLGWTLVDLGVWLQPEERGRFDRLFAESGRIRNFEAGLRQAGGRAGTGLVSADSIELNGVACVVTIFRDITGRKMAEAAIEASRNMLRQVLDSIPVRVFWKDRHSVFQGGNQLWAGDGGFDNADELIGKTDFDFSTPAEAAAYQADDRLVMASGMPKLRYEESRRGLQGEQRWLLTSKIPMRGPANDVIGVLGLYEDITERKQLELALREGEAHLAMAVAAAEMGTWEWHIKTGRVAWSERVAATFGIRLQDFAGTLEDYRSRIHPDDLALVTARINEALAVDAPDYRVEHRIKLPDGRVRWLEARGRVTRDAAGQPERLAGLVWDVTRRKEIENDLLRIAQGLGGVSGQALAGRIVATLSSVTGADCAFLGRLVDDHFIETVAGYEHGAPARNRRYDLRPSPCAEVVARGVCIYPADVQSRFPQDRALIEMGINAYAGAPLSDGSGRPVGLLVALFQSPLARPDDVKSIVSILATAAASDMARSQALAELTRGNAELEARVRARTDELQRLVNLMAGREVRMAELKAEIRRLQGQPANIKPEGAA